jgi:hypothetical protein
VDLDITSELTFFVLFGKLSAAKFEVEKLVLPNFLTATRCRPDAAFEKSRDWFIYCFARLETYS